MNRRPCRSLQRC